MHELSLITHALYLIRDRNLSKIAIESRACALDINSYLVEIICHESNIMHELSYTYPGSLSMFFRYRRSLCLAGVT